VSARAIRLTVIVVCLVSIAGMIVASIADSTGAAITFGLVAGVAIICLILVTASAPPEAFARTGIDEEAAAEVERRVQALADGGADEAEVRALVRAVRRLEHRSPR
jgi:hypothetical protein